MRKSVVKRKRNIEAATKSQVTMIKEVEATKRNEIPVVMTIRGGRNHLCHSLRIYLREQ